jgi:hypothetical protein
MTDHIMLFEGRQVTVLYGKGKSLRIRFVDGRERTVDASRVRPARTPRVPDIVAVGTPPRAGKMEAFDLLESIARRGGASVVRASDLRAVPKPPKPWRSEAYRAFVRDRRDCACCGAFAGSGDLVMEAHHHGPHAMGQKAGDETCIPLHLRCHRYFHDHGTFKGMDRAETDAVAARTQAELLTAYCHLTLGSTETHETIVDALIEAIRMEREG